MKPTVEGREMMAAFLHGYSISVDRRWHTLWVHTHTDMNECTIGLSHTILHATLHATIARLLSPSDVKENY